MENIKNSNYCYQCGYKFNEIKLEFFTGEKVFTFDNNIDTNLNNDDDTIIVRLFQIMSIVNNFKFKGQRYDNVKINWYVVNRKTPVIVYDKVAVHYSRMSGNERLGIAQYIDEKFTLREGRLLEKYIENTSDIKTVFEEIRIPIVENVRSFSNMIGVMNTSKISLYKKNNYNLPFKVEGIFNIKDAEESVSWDSQDTVISKNIRKKLENYMKKMDK
jgi:hypothetical protein